MAFRNIWRSKLRSALTIFAVVIGATSVTIMLTLVFSIKGFFTQQFEANGTLQQVAVSPQSGVSDYNSISNNGGGQGNCGAGTCTKLTDALVTKITALPHVVGVARATSSLPFAAIVFSGKPYTLQGVAAYDANGIITNNIVAGRDINATDQSGVVTVPSIYADKWGYKNNYKALVGQQIELETQGFYSGVGATIQKPNTSGPNNPPSPSNQQAPTYIKATVVGISSNGGGGGGGGQSNAVRVPLPWARLMEEQQMYQQTPGSQGGQNCGSRGQCQPAQPQFTLVVTNNLAQNGYDALTVKVDSATNANGVASSIRKLGVGAASAQSFIKSQLAIFNVIGLVLGGIGGIALAVAAVGVVNTMVMAILERTREIGVMRAVGAKRSTVSRLFTIEASVLGFLGGVIGLLIGYVLILIANPIINKQLKLNSIHTSNIINLPIWLILSVIGVTTLIGMLAGLYPARRAAKLDPVEALHYE